MDDVLARLEQLRGDDLPVHSGRTLAYVYDSGLPELDRLAAAAVGAFAATNGLDPTAFPSLLRMENDLVAFGLRLLEAPEGAVGTVSSGGTESVLLAVQGGPRRVPAGAAPLDGGARHRARGVPQGRALLRRRGPRRAHRR